MKLTIYNMKCEKITFPKPSDQLTEIATDLTCYLKENTSITHPSLVLYIKNGTDGAALYGANYCYIPKLGRYYFIDDIIIESDTIIRYNCTVDVLNSFSDSILNQTVLTSRNENFGWTMQGNPEFLKDDRLPLCNSTYVAKTEYGNIFNEPNNGSSYGWFAITYFSKSTDSITDPSFYVAPYGGTTYTVIIKYRKNFVGNLLDQIIDLITTNYSTVGSFICSIYLIPFLPTTDDYLNTQIGSIYIGNTTITPNLNETQGFEEAIYRVSDYCGIQKISWTQNSFLDIYPYSSYTVYLPLYGEVVLDYNRISENSFVTVTYNIDFTTGALVYKIIYSSGVGSDSEYNEIHGGIETYSCQILNPIPIDSTNSQEIDRQKEAYTLSYVGALVGSIASIAGGLASQNAGLAIEGAGGVISSSMSYAGSLKTLLVKGNSQQSSSMWLTYDTYRKTYSEYTNIILFKYGVSGLLDDDQYTKYKHLNGVPYVTTCSLTDLTGYTEISECHLDNVCSTTDDTLYATSEELDMIYEALTTGVIIETH